MGLISHHGNRTESYAIIIIHWKIQYGETLSQEHCIALGKYSRVQLPPRAKDQCISVTSRNLQLCALKTNCAGNCEKAGDERTSTLAALSPGSATGLIFKTNFPSGVFAWSQKRNQICRDQLTGPPIDKQRDGSQCVLLQSITAQVALCQVVCESHLTTAGTSN